MTDARQSQLLEQLDIAEKQSAVCDELAEALKTRLAGVLRQEVPAPDNGRLIKPSQEHLVPLAERVRTVSQRTGATISTLQSILERLEA